MNFKSKNIAFALIITALCAPQKFFAVERTNTSDIGSEYKRLMTTSGNFNTSVNNSLSRSQISNGKSFKEDKEQVIFNLKNELENAASREAMQNIMHLELAEKSELAQAAAKKARAAAKKFQEDKDTLTKQAKQQAIQSEKKKQRRADVGYFKQSILNDLNNYGLLLDDDGHLNMDNLERLAAPVGTDSENEFADVAELLAEEPAIRIQAANFKKGETPMTLSEDSKEKIRNELQVTARVYEANGPKNLETEKKIEKLRNILFHDSNARALKQQLDAKIAEDALLDMNGTQLLEEADSDLNAFEAGSDNDDNPNNRAVRPEEVKIDTENVTKRQLKVSQKDQDPKNSK